MAKKRAKRRCTYCGELGHDRRNCPKLAKNQPKKKPPQIVEGLVTLLNEAMEDVESSSMHAFGHPTLNVDKNGQLFIEETPDVTDLMALGVCQFYLAKARGGNNGADGL